MSCTRGCCATQAAHYASIGYQRYSAQGGDFVKLRRDVHDDHVVDVTEHFATDAQDVNVALGTTAVPTVTVARSDWKAATPNGL